MGYVTVEAPVRSELTTCVHCGLCLPHCPTFRLTGVEVASPRGRVAAMRAVLEGVTIVDDAFDEAISFCLGCRACEAACPSLVPYGRMLEGARAEVTAQRPTTGRRFRRFVLGRLLPNRGAVRLATAGAALLQRLPGRTRFPAVARRALDGLRRLQPTRTSWVGVVAEPRGTTRGTVALLVGCVMDSWFGEVHDATVGILQKAGYQVIVPPSQTCCGALAAHDGHTAVTRRLARRNVDAFGDVDLIVSDSAGCTAHLKEYAHWADGGEAFQSKVRDATELVAELIEQGALPRLTVDRGPVAVQDPCHLRHAQRIVAQPRAILRAAGHTPVEIDPDGLCCGAAGIYSLLRPAASGELGARKADQVRVSGATVVSSANPGCEMQLRAHLGSGYQIAHPLELYWESLRAAPAE